MTSTYFDERIARLERRNRWLSGGLVALAVASLTGLGIAHAGSTPAMPTDLTDLTDLPVRSLTVVDASGTTRVKIAAPAPPPIVMGKVKSRGGGVSGVILYDAKGNERGGYVTSDSKEYPNVLLTLDDEQRQRVLFLAEPGGATTLRLFKDKQNMAQMNLVDDRPGLQLVENGKVVFKAP